MDRWGSLGLERGRLAHFLLACALCVLALLLTAATWLPGPDRLPRGVPLALLLAVLLVFAAAVVRSRFSAGGARLLGPGNDGRLLWFVWDLPAGLKWCYAVVFALTLLGLAGAGTEQVRTDAHGVHYAVRKDGGHPGGERVVLSDAAYDRADRAEIRGFTAGAALFSAGGSLLVLVAASTDPSERAGRDPRRPS
ncbi:hypothetical protein ABZ883_18165 [Streptomyces sp. NPDC046977]|uniref:hypothetical protein n=1 Tax=Streptomyces sp. NPDC046977 TaxID=3154703 RepID=UPI0033FA58E5